MPSLPPGKYFSFTTRANGRLNTLINDVRIRNNQALTNEPSELREYKAIWDTGATGTVVTERVVSDCGLIPITETNVVGVHGSRISPVYLIDLHLPNNVLVEELQVTQAMSLSGPADVLIGMDIIAMGDFAVSNFGAETTFTFRLPSKERIDFVPRPQPPKVGRNDPCPCGSGKKYKKCHGGRTP